MEQAPTRSPGRRTLVVAAVLLAGLLVLHLTGAFEDRGPSGEGTVPAPTPASDAARAPPPDTAIAPVPSPAPGDPGTLPVAATPSSRVGGVVLDPAGNPATAALVLVLRVDPEPFPPREAPGPEREVVTDELGRWSAELSAGERILRARGEGTGTATATVVVPSDGSPVEAPNLRLPEGGRILGRVVDRDGKPLVAVRVRAWSEEGATGEVLHDGRRYILGGDDVVTGEDGAFVLRGLDDEAHRVAPDLALLPKLRSEPPETRGVRPGTEPLLFRVLGAARLRGIVADGATGEPVRTFTVAGTLFDRADGRFETEAGDEGEAAIASPGYRTRGIPTSGFGEEELRVALEPADESGRLVLLVSGAGGEPVEGLRAQGVTADFRTWVCTWTEGAREFRVGRTAAGEQTVFLQAEGWTPATVRVDVPRNGEARPEVRLLRCGAARLRILDARGNVLRHGPEALLLDSEGKGPPVRWVFTRPQGTTFTISEFQLAGGPAGTSLRLSEADGRLTGLLPGTYRIRIGEGEAAKETVFAVAAGEEVEVTIRLVP